MKANSDDMLGKIFTDSKSYYGSTSKTFIHEVSNENDEKILWDTFLVGIAEVNQKVILSS